jgi:hypothetical protein
MKFEIKTYITPEGDLIHFNLDDLKELEAFIKVNIKDRKYGEGATKFIWGFILFESKGIFEKFVEKEVAVLQVSTKQVLSNSHFDWKKLPKLSKEDAVKLIRKECLAAIARIGELKRKPKNFNIKLFHDEMKQVFDHYIKHNLK